MDLVVPVVERLHPVIVQLKVPREARRRFGIDDQCLVLSELPVAVVVAYVGVASSIVRSLLIEEWKGVDVLSETPCPSRKQV